MKAAIYSPYLDTLGGGERYVLSVARALTETGWNVDIESSDQNLGQKVKKRFGFDLVKANFVESVQRGNGYDLCFWLSDGSVPTLFARKNIVHFQRPFSDVDGSSLINKIKFFRINAVVVNSGFTKKWIDEADKILVPNGSIMICGSLHNIGEVIIALIEKKYKFINLITWKKTNPMPSITKRTLTHSTEFIVWFAKGKGWKFSYNKMKKYSYGKQLRDVWEFPICQGSERIKDKSGKAAHPTQKPLELFKRLIEMTTDERDIVLDPFIGSGTTAIASIQLNRNWIGIDDNKKYINLANKRIEKYKKNTKLKDYIK